MENQIKKSIKYWYIPLILGILLILAGAWVFSTPLASYITLSLFFAVTFLVVGIFQIFHAVTNRNDLDGWGWYLIGGIFDLVLGILLISQIGATMLVLAFFVGFGVLFRSIMGIGHSIELKKFGAKDWGILLFFGILGVLFSFILIWNPIFAGLTVVFYTGMAFIMAGLFEIFVSLRLRKLKKEME